MIATHSHARLWFRGPAGRRYGFEISAIVVAKILLLSILYFLFVSPQPHADTSPAALRTHLVESTTVAPTP